MALAMPAFADKGPGTGAVKAANEKISGLLKQKVAAGSKEEKDLATKVTTSVRDFLDIDELGKRAMVDQWKKLSAAQQTEFLSTLRALIEDFGRRTRIDVRIECLDAAQAVSPEAQVAIYRVLQEALTNVARHAHARRVSVRLEPGSRRLRLAVEDDGVGLHGPVVPHLGLLGMTERVSALGGTLRVANAEGGGVRVEACIPLEAPAESVP